MKWGTTAGAALLCIILFSQEDFTHLGFSTIWMGVVTRLAFFGREKKVITCVKVCNWWEERNANTQKCSLWKIHEALWRRSSWGLIMFTWCRKEPQKAIFSWLLLLLQTQIRRRCIRAWQGRPEQQQNVAFTVFWLTGLWQTSYLLNFLQLFLVFWIHLSASS